MSGRSRIISGRFFHDLLVWYNSLEPSRCLIEKSASAEKRVARSVSPIESVSKSESVSKIEKVRIIKNGKYY